MKIFSLASDKRGSATIELAIVAPMMALMVAGVVDLSMAYSHKLNIEQGAQRAIEKVMQTTTTDTVHGTLAKEAAAAAGVPENQVAVKYMRECDNGSGTPTEHDDSALVVSIQKQLDEGVALSAIDTSGLDCASGYTERRYITVTITDLYDPVIDPQLVGLKSQDGKFPMTIETGIRTQ